MILIIDDDRTVRLSLKILLKRAGYETAEASSPAEALRKMRESVFSLIFMDMNYSISTDGGEGLHLLSQASIFQPGIPVILITAWGSIELAVAGMKGGAFDFVTKPWSNADLLQKVETALSLTSVKNGAKDLQEFDRCGIIGNNRALMDVLETARKVSMTDAPVLILGENGTGKELVAQALHVNSRRAKAPFVMVNLGGVSQSLFESEMFGHAKGAFTGAVSERKGRFEAADKGTIFLDEIGDLDLSCQVKLLRVLQQHTFERLGETTPRKVDMRVICATNADLQSMVASRQFREDLYYRINLVTLRLPPLRERRDDIPALANHFVREEAKAMRIIPPDISADAMKWLVTQPYPGNIRQLKNIIGRAMIICRDSRIELADLDTIGMTDTSAESASRGMGAGLDLLERNAIIKALHDSGGNLSRAAMNLGISRQSLYRRLEKYGIKE